MRCILIVFLMFGLMAVISHQTNGQINNGKSQSNKKPCTSKSITNDKKKAGKETDQFERDAKYYASIRYVVIYNDLIIGERRIEVFIEEKQFNKQNLIRVFNLLKKRYPMPVQLDIHIHTSLSTIETPEERELVRDAKDSRFRDYYDTYKEASYTRFENGREAMLYTISLSPYKRKLVVLSPAKITKK